MITPRPYQTEAVKAILDAVKRGVRRQLVSLPTGCHAPGTKILMYDGALKPVEEIKVGDLLMGPDSTERRVLRLIRGSGEMYRISPVKGEPFVVNEDHVLSLKKTNERSEKSGRVYPSTKPGTCDITVKDYRQQSKTFKHTHKLYRAGVEFQRYVSWFDINPYFMGVLLGDGGFSNTSICVTTPDWEIVQEIKAVANELGLDVRHQPMPGNKASNYFLVTKGRRLSPKFSNPIREALRAFGLLGHSSGEKFIPEPYKTAPRRDRLELLAGLIDTDGSNNQCGGFEYSTKSQRLSEDVLFVARSLGLAAYRSEKLVNGATYYRLTISGDCSIVPTRVERKRATERRQIKDPLVSGFSVSSEGVGEYFGFTVDKDNLYLMGDFTVTHNCGKTIVFAILAKMLNVPTLILAHREELLTQARAKMRLVDPQADVGILQAEETGGMDARICVASIQTASRPRRLETLKGRGFELCIVDEAHHASAESYENTLKELGFLSDDPRRLLVGVTATAYRGDGVALGAIFDEVVYERTIMAMISGGYLTDARGISVTTETDLSGIHTRMGDFVTSELSWALNTPQRNALIAQAYKDNASDRRAVAFCVDVAHSKDLAEAFRSAGVSCEPIWGDMDRESRRRTLSDYAAGKIQVLTNCSVLTEGWDDPATSAILLARPTKSPTLYTQMVGRGLRTSPGKADCLVIDFADTVGRHSLCGFATLAGLPMMKHKSGETLSEAVERFDMAEDWKRERMGQVRKEAVDLFERSAFTWTPVTGGHFRLTAGDGRYVWLRNMPEGYAVILVPTEGARENLSEAPLPMGYAQGVAEDWVRLHGVKSLAEKDAKWRRNPASDKQLALLKKWAVPHDPATITAGEASGLIDMEMARAQNRREEPASHKQKWFIRVKLGKKDLPEGLTKGQATRIIAQAQREKKGVA